jgi:hypothetical protein
MNARVAVGLFILAVVIAGPAGAQSQGAPDGAARVAQAKPLPQRIAYEGQTGASVRGTFVRARRGVWIERNNQNPKGIAFAVVSEGPERIVLRDASRGIAIEIDLRARVVRLRQGSGSWRDFYKVVGVQ